MLFWQGLLSPVEWGDLTLGGYYGDEDDVGNNANHSKDREKNTLQKVFF